MSGRFSVWWFAVGLVVLAGCAGEGPVATTQGALAATGPATSGRRATYAEIQAEFRALKRPIFTGSETVWHLVGGVEGMKLHFTSEVLTWGRSVGEDLAEEDHQVCAIFLLLDDPVYSGDAFAFVASAGGEREFVAKLVDAGYKSPTEQGRWPKVRKAVVAEFEKATAVNGLFGHAVNPKVFDHDDPALTAPVTVNHLDPDEQLEALEVLVAAENVEIRAAAVQSLGATAKRLGARWMPRAVGILVARYDGEEEVKIRARLVYHAAVLGVDQPGVRPFLERVAGSWKEQAYVRWVARRLLEGKSLSDVSDAPPPVTQPASRP